MHTRHFFAGLVGVSLVTAAYGRPVAPDRYDVTLRYRINAVGNDRLAQYFAMVKYLKSIGFVRTDPQDVPETEPVDARNTRMQGTLPAGKIAALFGDPHVAAARLVPHGTAVPENKEQRVRVSLKLASGMPGDLQHVLAEQTLQVLNSIGFQEAVGYDHHGFTRLLGTLPVGQLDAVLDDFRSVPAAARLAAPIQSISPVLLSEVRPDLPLPAARPAPVAPPQGQERIGPELRELLADGSQAAVPVRMEVLLAVAPDAHDRDWQKPFGGVRVEGRLGTLVSVLGSARDALTLASLPNVVGVRLPRPAQSQVLALDQKDSARPLLAPDAARLHALGNRGKGTRVALVDADFRGWEKRLGHGLPRSTRLLDLTRTRNRSLEPDPASPGDLGTGTRCALAAARIAPDADFVLVRIDPAAPYMLETVARAINGDPVQSINLDNRLAELDRESAELEKRHNDVMNERRANLEEFPPPGEESSGRKEYLKKLAALDHDEKELLARSERYQAFRRELAGLRGVRIVSCGLAWPDGYPVDGSSALSRFFDDRPFRAALWFQCAGDTRGQAWTGLFRDEDGNGVAEFAARGGRLPRGAWTSELNFLSWQNAAGSQVRDLPAGARVRLSLTWREPHDPGRWRAGEDAFREPLADLHLVVLRQLSPDGTAQPADDLEVVTESSGVPLRLEASAGAGTYEQVVELRIVQPGRYAVRIEGRLPESALPRGAASLPGSAPTLEVKPRLFAQTLSGTGRAVFDTFPTEAASLVMPADAHRVLAVGAAGADGKPRPYSARGPAHNLDLLPKPEALVGDAEPGGAAGTALAAAHAAGWAAALRSAGTSLTGVQQALQFGPGHVLPEPQRDPRR